MAGSSEITGVPVSSLSPDDPRRPSGQENFFAEVGVPVASRTAAPPKLEEKAQPRFLAKVLALAPKYKTELLPPA
jgi:hypothetical protein